MSKLSIFLLTVSFLFIGCSEESVKTNPSNNISVEKIENITKENLLSAINKVRSQQIDCNDGLGLVGPFQPLVWNDELFTAAYEHSNDLSQSNTFSHDGSGAQSDITGLNLNKKSSFVERIEANGYHDYNTIGENIAVGYSEIEPTIQAWLTSPKHCNNIMNPKFKEMAIAITLNLESDFKIYWTNNFGTKK